MTTAIATYAPEVPVEFLRDTFNSELDCCFTFLGPWDVDKLTPAHNGGESYISRKDFDTAMEDARYNQSILNAGIGITRHGSSVTLIHGKNSKTFRGSSVDFGNTLTHDDRKYCRTLMGLE